MPLFNNMFKKLYNQTKLKFNIFNIEIYNKYFIIYHMYIRYKIHKHIIYKFLN
jgi:hypothetical protein